MQRVKNERHGAAEERRMQKKNKEKRKGGEELVFFAVHRVFLTLPVDQGPCTCQHTCVHMFLLLHDRLRREYSETVCALGGGMGRGGGVKDEASSPTVSSTFPYCICPHEVFQSCLWGPALSSLSSTYSSRCKKEEKKKDSAPSSKPLQIRIVWL